MTFSKFLIAATIATLIGSGSYACEDGEIELRGERGKFLFQIDVADTEPQRNQGLMFVENMPRFSGMLFIYEKPIHAHFWMKNTLIPLDMLFADETGTVTRVFENAEPHSLASIDGGEDVLYVLEINGGLADKFGLSEGTVMRHPAIDEKIAAWKCEN